MIFEFAVPPFEVKVTVDKEDWAPGIFAGCEGMKLTIVKVDLENRILVCSYDCLIEETKIK